MHLNIILEQKVCGFKNVLINIHKIKEILTENVNIAVFSEISMKNRYLRTTDQNRAS